MSEVKSGNEESFDNLLRRFNKKVQEDRILAELRSRQHFEKPSIKRKRKKAAKKRNAAKAAKAM